MLVGLLWAGRDGHPGCCYCDAGKPDVAEPEYALELVCVVCEGRGRDMPAGDPRYCPACGGCGVFEAGGRAAEGAAGQCPWREIPETVRGLSFAAEQARLGVWYGGGGWGDQADNLVEAVRYYWSEEAIWKARRTVVGE